MTVRYYSSTAVQTTLNGGITSGGLSIVVNSVAGFPSSFPYTLAIDYGTGAEELVSVTAAAGLTLTITRAFNGTSAQPHSSGATVKHVACAVDFTDSRDHENASTNVHGLSGGAAVVGTTSTQTLTNKTINAATINGSSLLTCETVTVTPSITGIRALDINTQAGSTVDFIRVRENSVDAFIVDNDGQITVGPKVFSYTPTWTALTVNPAIGNGTLTGSYSVIGKVMYLWVRMVTGTTTTYGTGNWFFSLPGGYTADHNFSVYGYGVVQTSASGSKASSVSVDVTSGNVIQIGTAGAANDGSVSAAGALDSATPRAWSAGTANQFVHFQAVIPLT